MRRSEQFGRTPKAILTGDVSDRAVRIYGLLAMTVFHGNVAKIGMRRLADQAKCSRASVGRAVKELITAGHLTAGALGSGERAYYVLNSPIFGSKQRALDSGEAVAEELVSFPRRRLATVRKMA